MYEYNMLILPHNMRYDSDKADQVNKLTFLAASL